MDNNIEQLLTVHQYNLGSKFLLRFRDNYEVAMACIKHDISMIRYCGDRIRDNYFVASYVLSMDPSYLWYFSIRLQTHPDIVAIISHTLDEEGILTPELQSYVQINHSEGTRRRALCSML